MLGSSRAVALGHRVCVLEPGARHRSSSSAPRAVTVVQGRCVRPSPLPRATPALPSHRLLGEHREASAECSLVWLVPGLPGGCGHATKRPLKLASGARARPACGIPSPTCGAASQCPLGRAPVYADRGPESRALPPVERATHWQGTGRRTSRAPAMLVPLPTAHLGRALSSRRPGEQASRQAGPERRPRAHRCRLGSGGAPLLPAAHGLLGARRRRHELPRPPARRAYPDSR